MNCPASDLDVCRGLVSHCGFLPKYEFSINNEISLMTSILPVFPMVKHGSLSSMFITLGTVSIPRKFLCLFFYKLTVGSDHMAATSHTIKVESNWWKKGWVLCVEQGLNARWRVLVLHWWEQWAVSLRSDLRVFWPHLDVSLHFVATLHGSKPERWWDNVFCGSFVCFTCVMYRIAFSWLL